MGSFLRDLRYGVRTLANNPGFTVVAVAVLSYGRSSAGVFCRMSSSLLVVARCVVQQYDSLATPRAPRPATKYLALAGDW